MTSYLQEAAARGVDGWINLGHHLSGDVSLHLEPVAHAAVRLHLVGHVDEGLAEVDSHHLLEHARHLKGGAAHSAAQVQRPAAAATAAGGGTCQQRGSSPMGMRQSEVMPCAARTVQTQVPELLRVQQRKGCAMCLLTASCRTINSDQYIHGLPVRNAASPAGGDAGLGRPAGDHVTTLLGEVQAISQYANLSQVVRKCHLQRTKVQRQVLPGRKRKERGHQVW